MQLLGFRNPGVAVLSGTLNGLLNRGPRVVSLTIQSSMRIGNEPGQNRQRAFLAGLADQTKIDRPDVVASVFRRTPEGPAVFGPDQIEASLQFSAATLHFIA